MGDPHFSRKQYGTPKKPWDKKLLEHERELRETYGLRNKKELRKVDAFVRSKRSNAKQILALPLIQRATREKELLDSLIRLGIMRGKPALNEVLSLNVEAFLERRLQTLAWRKNLSNSIKQARQFITHGHIAVNGKKVTAPSYLVTKAEEMGIGYYGNPMELQTPQRMQRDKKQLQKEFAEMRGEPEGTESKLIGEEEEKPINPDAAETQIAEEGS